jgi:hypothetical protein
MKTRVANGAIARLISAAALLLTFGCAAAPDGSPAVGVVRQGLFDNDQAAYDYFRAKGLTNFQAAGVVGNLDQESGIDPTIWQLNGGPGRGIAQWSAGARWDSTDGDNVVQFASQHGQDEYSLALQLDFVWYELTSFEWYGLAELQASTSLEQATQVFEDKYEGCVYANYPECALPRRIEFAQGILDAFGDNPAPDDGGDGDDSADDGSTDGDADDGSASDDSSADGSAGDGSSEGDSADDGSANEGGADGSSDGTADSSDDGDDGTSDDGAVSEDGASDDSTVEADGAAMSAGELDGCTLTRSVRARGGDLVLAFFVATILVRRRRVR